MKYLSTIVTVLFFSLSFLFLLDGLGREKYYVYKLFMSPFQKEYEKSTYYEFKVPDEWILANQEEDYNTYIGPAWNNENTTSYINVFINYNNFEHYIHWFDESSCQEVDDIVEIINVALLRPSQNSVNVPSKIIFCNKNDNNRSYVAYLSHGAITYIHVESYDRLYKDKYIDLFQKIEYIIDEVKTPKWAIEE